MDADSRTFERESQHDLSVTIIDDTLSYGFRETEQSFWSMSTMANILRNKINDPDVANFDQKTLLLKI